MRKKSDDLADCFLQVYYYAHFHFNGTNKPNFELDAFLLFFSKQIFYYTIYIVKMKKKSKQEINQVFKNIEGFYNNKTVFDFYKPKDSLQKLQLYNWFKLQYLDSSQTFALYKVIQIIYKEEYENVLNFATSMPVDDLFRFSIQGAVARYNKSTGKFNVRIVDYDDKSEWEYEGDNEKIFNGFTTEVSLNTDLNNDNYLFGGNVGGGFIKKMKYPIKDFKNTKFNDLYQKIYKKAYPENKD